MMSENDSTLVKQLHEHAIQLGDLAERKPFHTLLRAHSHRKRSRRRKYLAGLSVGALVLLCCWSYFGNAKGLIPGQLNPNSKLANRPDTDAALKTQRDQLIGEIVAVLGVDPTMTDYANPLPTTPAFVEVKYEDLSPNEQTAVQRLLTVSVDQWN